MALFMFWHISIDFVSENFSKKSFEFSFGLIWGRYRSSFRRWSMLLPVYGKTETWISLHKQCTCTITYCYVVRGRLHSLQEKELIEQYENMGIG